MKKKIFSLTLIIMMLLVSFMLPTTIAVEEIISIGPITAKPLEGIKVEEIIGAVKWIGYVIAIGMIIWSGVKYVMSGASEKAQAKETLIPIVIGSVLVVAGIEITAAVFSIFEQK